MTLSRRTLFRIAGTTAAAGATGVGGAGALHWHALQQAATGTDVPLNVHLLNRISFGATPDDVAAIDRMGYDAYLDEQLNPEAIDDSAIEARLLPYTSVLDLSLMALQRLPDVEFRLYLALRANVILRALHSKRQLHERMVEFWSDHFNVAGEDLFISMVPYYNQDIRDNAMGNFRKLLIATAKAPAMLVYLDNFVNIARHPNENYARELLELHTLGVDGGYTEADVENVARAFTGWTIHERLDDGFIFNANHHDTDAKQILGHTLPAGRGVEDGLHVLDILARHPATAQFISRKLAVAFVSDTPPQSLVDSTAVVFIENNGEIRPVLRHLFTSVEFKASAGQKLRRPFTFYMAGLRAAGASVTDIEYVNEHLGRLGQAPYQWLPPNGYPAVAAPWMTTNGLLERWNGAMRMTEGAQDGDYTGVRVELHRHIGSPTTVGELVRNIGRRVYGYDLSPEQLAPFVRYASDDSAAGADTPITPALLSRKMGGTFGLMIASPQFQWI